MAPHQLVQLQLQQQQKQQQQQQQQRQRQSQQQQQKQQQQKRRKQQQQQQQCHNTTTTKNKKYIIHLLLKSFFLICICYVIWNIYHQSKLISSSSLSLSLSSSVISNVMDNNNNNHNNHYHLEQQTHSARRRQQKSPLLLNKNQIIITNTTTTTTTTTTTKRQVVDPMLLQTTTKEQQQQQQQQQHQNTTTTTTTTTSTNITTTTNTSTTTNIIKINKNDYIYNKKSWDSSPIIIEKYKLIFFTIQKNGCTIWKQLFRRMLGIKNWYLHTNIHNPKTNSLKYLYHYNISYATQLLNDPTYIKAIFVRNPKDKFLSSYLDKAFHNNGLFLYDACCNKQKKYKNKKYIKDICKTIIRNNNNTNNNNNNNNINNTNTTTTTTKTTSTTTTNNNNTTTTPIISFKQFIKLTKYCHNSHWIEQSKRLGGNNGQQNTKYLSILNFIGHMETIQYDSKQLLLQLGIWEQYGLSGWGKYMNESIFQSTSNVLHATTTTSSSSNTNTNTNNQKQKQELRLAKYYTPELEYEIDQRFANDYLISKFQLQRKPINYSLLLHSSS